MEVINATRLVVKLVVVQDVNQIVTLPVVRLVVKQDASQIVM